MRKVVNWGQFAAIGVALLATFVVYAIPPYSDSGGLIGGTVYYPFSGPPDDPYISPNTWLLKWELGYIGLTFAAALIAFGKRRDRCFRTLLFVGLAIEVTLFGFGIRQFHTILAPELTWYALNLVALVVLIVIALTSGSWPRRSLEPVDPDNA
jgi:hypothetical protein